MDPSAASGDFPPKELFRYVSVVRPKVVDLPFRARRSSAVREVLTASEREQRRWAETFLESPRMVRSIDDLTFPAHDHLRREPIETGRLPTRADLIDPDDFAVRTREAESSLRDDQERCLLSALALHLLAAPQQELDGALWRLGFLDTLPTLHRVRSPQTPARGLVTGRADAERPSRKLQPSRPTAEADRTSDADEAQPTGGAPVSAELPDQLFTLWQAKNRRHQHLQRAADEALQAALTPSPDRAPTSEQVSAKADADTRLAIEQRPVARTPEADRGREPDREPGRGPGPARGRDPGGSAKPRDENADPDEDADGDADGAARRANERAAARRERHRRRVATLATVRAERQALRTETDLVAVLAMEAAELVPYAPGMTETQIADAQQQVQAFVTSASIPLAKFCNAYEEATVAAEAAPKPGTSPSMAGCFDEAPRVAFADAVRILGRGDLIRVDETFLRYTPGELSYVETVLAGELRERERKQLRSSEEVTERAVEETLETASERQSTSKQDLASQIESELETKFKAGVKAAAEASGGGTIGVVSFEGSGDLEASTSLAVDSSISTSDKSSFAQEIVDKAVENTKRVSVEKRRTRTFQQSETLDRHRIDNTGDDPRHRNGVYCFLDKHVLVTQTKYGQRLFLLASIRLPGKNLLCDRVYRRQLALADTGDEPTFDITPSDITPANYLELVGRFKANGVSPPPAPIVTLGRVYKTDVTNVVQEQGGSTFEKVVDVLVPFFERYQRFLVTDSIRLPDGYAVADVNVTISHGRNGVSIPAHLPLTVGGGLLYMAPSLPAYAVYGPLLIPYWMWHLSYLASPMLHYNADSSNVTITVGNESQESSYYFFPPDFLIGELLDLLGSMTDMLPRIRDFVEDNLEPLFLALAGNAMQVPEQVASTLREAITGVLEAFADIIENFNPLTFDGAALANDVLAIVTSFDLTAFTNVMADFFEPLHDFLQSLIDFIDDGIGAQFSGLTAFLLEMFENSQSRQFHGAAGAQGELPVAFNTVAINPGVTINLTACLRRTPEALDRWRLQTFSLLYQGHLQQLADYENRVFAERGTGRVERPPALLRQEERLVLKERILHGLNNLHTDNGNNYSLERLSFFEHAIDWDNLSYRVFNYGPTRRSIELDKLGIFAGGDPERRAFLTAVWAQALLPVRDDERLEEQIQHYVEAGAFDLEGDLEDEELVAVYRDLIQGREDIGTPVGEPREVVLPTEFVVVMTDELAGELPVNDALVTAGAVVVDPDPDGDGNVDPDPDGDVVLDPDPDG
jgi:hypothetical protein